MQGYKLKEICEGKVCRVGVGVHPSCGGAWGKEAQQSFSKLASRFAVHGCVPKSMATFELYARLNISLMRANSRAMLSRS